MRIRTIKPAFWPVDSPNVHTPHFSLLLAQMHTIVGVALQGTVRMNVKENRLLSRRAGAIPEGFFIHPSCNASVQQAVLFL